MGGYDAAIDNEFLSYVPFIVLWHQITLLSIDDPFNLSTLYSLFSQMSNLRTLDLNCSLDSRSDDNNLRQRTLISFLNDIRLCNMLTSNRLRQLNLWIQWDQPNLIDVTYFIAERLSHFQIIELRCVGCQVAEILHILTNGLQKLNFLINFNVIICMIGDWVIFSIQVLVFFEPKCMR
jgi:hypothetical protein